MQGKQLRQLGSIRIACSTSVLIVTSYSTLVIFSESFSEYPDRREACDNQTRGNLAERDVDEGAPRRAAEEDGVDGNGNRNGTMPTKLRVMATSPFDSRSRKIASESDLLLGARSGCLYSSSLGDGISSVVRTAGSVRLTKRVFVQLICAR